jgi:hypothetical protein
MTALIFAVLVLNLLVSCAGFWLLRERQGFEAQSLHELGMEYARLALLYAKDKGEEKAALEAFRIIDSTADGKRDFTDAQARVFLDAAAK